MRIHHILVCLALGALLGCSNGTSPADRLPNDGPGMGRAPSVSGRWLGWRPEFSLTLDLVQEGTSVHGTASSWGFINPPTHSYTIAGTYSAPSVTLTLTRSDSVVSSLTGTVADANHMIVVSTMLNDTLRFAKQ